MPYGGVGHCLGPEGNGVSSVVGGEEGPGPPDKEQSNLCKKEATWTRRKKARRARCDEGDPVCTE